MTTSEPTSAYDNYERQERKEKNFQKQMNKKCTKNQGKL